MNLYNFARGIFRLLFSVMRWKVIGQEKIPMQGPVILVINHISLWDPVVAASGINRRVHFMAKEELFTNFLLGTLCRKLGAFPVKRGQGDMSAIRQSLNLLKEGEVLGLFPEGTRSKTGKLQKALPGMVLLMEKSKAPIIPIKIFGTKNLFTEGWGKLSIVIGDPINLQILKIPEGTENHREWIAQEIMNRMDALHKVK